jgi:hypothetical protein
MAQPARHRETRRKTLTAGGPKIGLTANDARTLRIWRMRLGAQVTAYSEIPQSTWPLPLFPYIILAFNGSTTGFTHMIGSFYSSNFYADHNHESRLSANMILPPIFKVLRPQSVIDVGCGAGVWMAAAKSLGARCVGLEGDWIKDVKPPELDIRVVDLEQPITLDQRFDLAVCVEVAEHLSGQRGPGLIHDLCRLSDCVLFSAAIPGQGGTNHINEQWQSYWADLFAKNGFVQFDCVRPPIWNNKIVARWYRQNAFLYVAKSRSNTMRLQRQSEIAIDIVHPEAMRNSLSLRSFVASLLPYSVSRTIRMAERQILYWFRRS